MSTTNPPQLFLLADHIKLSLLERQRAVSLNLPSNSQDSQISRSLEQLRSGIETLESQVQDVADDAITSQLPRLHAHLADLTSQFTPTTTTTTSSPAPTTAPNPRSKSVRFRDTADDDDDTDPSRTALFAAPYRDDPSPDTTSSSDPHADLSNQQLHEHHSHIISQQDTQLDALGASIGRQRELSQQIGDELDSHVLLLDDVEEGVDRHAAQMRRARGRLDRFGRKARENWSLSVIVVLIVVLVLLIVITK